VLLDFLVPGFSQCGTTALCAVLSQHRQIFMPEATGARYFDLQDYETRSVYFEKRFAMASPSAVIGDRSVWYTRGESERLARERILRHFPEIKLILLVRDPLARIEAAFREHHHRGHLCDIECPFELGDAVERIPSLVEDSLYGQRLANYEPYMEKERVLVLFLEELIQDPAKQLARCFQFLDVEPDAAISSLPSREPESQTLRDTPRLREMRQSSELASALQSVPSEQLDQVLLHLGLRVPFDAPQIDWSEGGLRPALTRIVDDATRFLEHQGRSVDVWPHLAANLHSVDWQIATARRIGEIPGQQIASKRTMGLNFNGP